MENELYCCECDLEIRDKDLGYGYNLIADAHELICSVCQNEMCLDTDTCNQRDMEYYLENKRNGNYT